MRRNNTTLGENLFGLKKQLNNKMTDRLQELEITKQLKILENDLRKQENALFFDFVFIERNDSRFRCGKERVDENQDELQQ